MADETTNHPLVRTLTRERLTKYIHAAGGDVAAALRLYERNMLLSEAFYTPLQCVEVCLRNALNGCMTTTYGAGWFRNGNAPLITEAHRMIGDAERSFDRAPSPPTDGQMVAELKFALWVSLLGRQYDATLWRRSLHNAFRADGGKRRSDVHGRFNAIRRFRNRIAHHEPVFNRDLKATHAEMIEAIGWMCRDTRAWTASLSRLPALLESA